MFDQYCRLSEPPDADWTAVYKTGKYLLMPEYDVCKPNEKVGKRLLQKATDKGLSKARHQLGRSRIKQRRLDKGLDLFFLSHQMGYLPALIAFLDTGLFSLRRVRRSCVHGEETWSS
jgi:hypothetical protein